MVYLRILVTTARLGLVWTRFNITWYCIHDIPMALVEHGSATERRKETYMYTYWHHDMETLSASLICDTLHGPVIMVPFTSRKRWSDTGMPENKTCRTNSIPANWYVLTTIWRHPEWRNLHPSNERANVDLKGKLTLTELDVCWKQEVFFRVI